MVSRRDKGIPELGEIKAFLGEGTEFRGVLSFQGTVRIDGHLQGEVVGGDFLIVGEGGELKAEVEVGTLIASGKIVGNVRAKKRVELLASSSVIGNITTPCLVVAEGAIFNGTCDMGRLEQVERMPVESGRGSGAEG